MQSKDILQIDFAEITGGRENSVVLPSVVVNELNDIKDRDTNSKKKDKARKSIKTVVEADETKLLREGIRFDIHYVSADFSYPSNNLNSGINDDILIAAIIEHSINNNESICLITLDIALKLRVKRFGITTFDLPEKYIIDDAPDPLTVENERLKSEIRALQNRLPKIDIKFLSPFSDDTHKASFKINYLVVDEKQIETAIQKDISKYKKQDYDEYIKHDVGESQSISKSLTAIMELNNKISKDEFERYNAEVDTYAKEIREYHTTCFRYQNAIGRSISFQIGIENSGTCPAKGVDVLLKFPNGFRLFEKEEFPEIPKKPSPPAKPMTVIEKINRGFHIPILPTLSGYHSFNNDTITSNFNIEETNSYEVSDYFDSIKHGTAEPLPTMLLIFDSYQEAKSFHCEYEIRPDNHPEVFSGQLHFIIEK